MRLSGKSKRLEIMGEVLEKAISKSTPVTIGVMLAFLTLAFALGGAFVRLTGVETKSETTEQAIQKITDLMVQHEYRIGILEHEARSERRRQQQER